MKKFVLLFLLYSSLVYADSVKIKDAFMYVITTAASDGTRYAEKGQKVFIFGNLNSCKESLKEIRLKKGEEAICIPLKDLNLNN